MKVTFLTVLSLQVKVPSVTASWAPVTQVLLTCHVTKLFVTNPRVLGDPGQPQDEAVLLLRGDGGQLALVAAGAR